MEIRAHAPVAPDKDILIEIRTLPHRRAKDAAKDTLIAQTLYEDEDNEHLLLFRSNKWGEGKGNLYFVLFQE